MTSYRRKEVGKKRKVGKKVGSTITSGKSFTVFSCQLFFSVFAHLHSTVRHWGNPPNQLYQRETEQTSEPSPKLLVRNLLERKICNFSNNKLNFYTFFSFIFLNLSIFVLKTTTFTQDGFTSRI